MLLFCVFLQDVSAFLLVKVWTPRKFRVNSCKFEFYKDVNAFYKSESCNYGESDKAWINTLSNGGLWSYDKY